MGQPKEEQIDGFQRIGMHELQPTDIAQVGMDAVHIAPRLFAAGDLGDLDMGVEVQQAQQLAAGITAAAQDADADHVSTPI